MREGAFEKAKTLLKAAGFSNYHNYHSYADFDRWLDNDQAVIITLNQEDGTFYALYRASSVPGGDLETTPSPVQKGDVASLTAETIGLIVSSFDKALVFPPKLSPTPQAGQPMSMPAG